MSAEFQVQMPAAIVQLEAYYAANWAVTDWYIDGVVGSDTNTGTSAATPLKTGAELQRRIGTYAKWSHSVTIHVLANGMTDALTVRGTFSGANQHLDVIGTPKVLVSDQISSYLAYSHATPRATEIVGTAITNFTAYQWKRVRITSGLRAGWIAWIAKANPNGVGVATARVSPGVAISYTSTSSILNTSLVPSNGDNFVIEDLPFIPAITIELDGPVSTNYGAGFPIWDGRQLTIQNVNCPLVRTNATGSHWLSRSFLFGCQIASYFPSDSLRDSTISAAIGCFISTNYGTNIVIYFSPQRCLIGNITGNVFVSSVPVILASTLIQGTMLTISMSSSSISDCQFFDCTNANGAFRLSYGSYTAFTSSGDNNAVGIGIANNVALAYTSLNIKGTTDCKLTATPAINLTQAQCFQPNDYAQKGVATLVGGTVTVTVPWYENTIQRVTATRNVVGGTRGDLTVAQISNTQFTITSDNALDTSTVNWTISPLGRNVAFAAA